MPTSALIHMFSLTTKACVQPTFASTFAHESTMVHSSHINMTNPPRAPRQIAAKRQFQTIRNTLAPPTDRETQRQARQLARNELDEQPPPERKADRKRQKTASQDCRREDKKGTQIPFLV
jgi:hypothetical protein